MKKFKGKYEQLFEQTYSRYQLGGFLSGEVVYIDERKLRDSFVEGLAASTKEWVVKAARDKQEFVISAIKTDHSDSFNGPVGSPTSPGEKYADIYVQYAPGMLKDVLTVPIRILKRKDPEENNLPGVNKDLVRPNDMSANGPGEVDQTMGRDKERNLPGGNTAIKSAPAPKPGPPKR